MHERRGAALTRTGGRAPVSTKSRATLIVAGTFLTLLTGLSTPADGQGVHSELATASKKSTSKRTTPDPVVTTIKLGPSIDVKKLVDATRTAALRDATRFRVSVGKPVCPSGSALTAPAVQCLVALGKVTVAYLVRPDGFGAFVAEPTFPIIATSTVETVAATSMGPLAKAVCGKDTFQSLPPGSRVACSVIESGRTRTVHVRVTDRYGSLRIDS